MEQSVDLKQVLGYKFQPQAVSYNRRDVLTYALGIGACEERFAYEDDGDFATFPTYPVVLSMKGTSSDVVQFGTGGDMIPPGLVIDPGRLLHGEQSIELFGDLPTEGEFTQESRVVGFWDKGKGALMETETLMKDAQGTVVCKLGSGIFFRGLTGFGGERGDSAPKNVPPKRAPDVVEEIQTRPEQALLYRLSGDYNPLHADPSMAQMVGFERPILHGLCSFAISARGVLKGLCDNDPSKLRSVQVRFVSPVYPGETLVVEAWRDGNGAIFQTKVKERNLLVIANARADFTPRSRL
mmetsp:Transcript_12610/g.29442  ORF Transcript_12610/g.29442 Transcript_12610/m.29442 type:complete len:296 (+) Transcript_12610:16-903(+)